LFDKILGDAYLKDYATTGTGISQYGKHMFLMLDLEDYH
jgi:hypothetical protein